MKNVSPLLIFIFKLCLVVGTSISLFFSIRAFNRKFKNDVGEHDLAYYLFLGSILIFVIFALIAVVSLFLPTRPRKQD